MMSRYPLALCALFIIANAEAGQIDVLSTIMAKDFLAEDDHGKFYYDVYDMTVAVPTTITLGMHANAAMQPWLAWWDHVVLPQLDWHLANPDSPYFGATIDASALPGDSFTMASFIALPGLNYQLAASTLDYLPGAHLGAYALTVDYGNAREGTVSINARAAVPEPGTLALMALGGVLAGWPRRRGA